MKHLTYIILRTTTATLSIALVYYVIHIYKYATTRYIVSTFFKGAFLMILAAFLAANGFLGWFCKKPPSKKETSE